MCKSLLKIFLLLLFTQSYAQTPSVTYSNFFGSTYFGSKAFGIAKTLDNGVVIAGQTASYPEGCIDTYANAFIVKLNTALEVQWQRCYGWGGLHDILPLADGGYVAVGFKSSNYYILKVNNVGDIIWERTYGLFGSDKAYSVSIDSNGNYLVAGTSGSMNYEPGAIIKDKYWVLRLDAGSGDQVGTYYFGGEDHDRAYSAVATANGGFAVVGETYSNEGVVDCRAPSYCATDWWVVNSDANGNILWSKCYLPAGTGANNFNAPKQILKTPDGGFIICGAGINSPNASEDAWIIKTDAQGQQQWKKIYGGTDHDYAHSIALTSDGGYIVVGETSSTDGDISNVPAGMATINAWAIKLNSSGEMVWDLVFGSSAWDKANKVIELSPNEYMVAGYSYGNDFDTALSNGRRFWAVRISDEALAVPEFNIDKISLSPNPVSNQLFLNYAENVGIQVCDISGREVMKLPYGTHQKLDVSKLSSGLYMITFQGSRVVTLKFIKE